MDTPPPSTLRRVVREPLLHFLLIGAGLFGAYGLASDPQSGTADDTTIVVSKGRVEQLSTIFEKTWQRPPTDEEFKGLVDDFVLEEITYRQAKAMGIDRDDTVIRRRLRQKFEFLTDDMASAEPTDAELQAYLVANPDSFRRGGTSTFQQVYINPERPDAKAFVAKELAALKAGGEAHGNGLIPASFDRATSRTIDGTFGAGFSTKLDPLPLGEWLGPIESGLGLHLVRIDAREGGSLPELSTIRPLVEREWAYARRLENRRALNERLLAGYTVIVEGAPKSQ